MPEDLGAQVPVIGSRSIIRSCSWQARSPEELHTTATNHSHIRSLLIVSKCRRCHLHVSGAGPGGQVEDTLPSLPSRSATFGLECVSSPCCSDRGDELGLPPARYRCRELNAVWRQEYSRIWNTDRSNRHQMSYPISQSSLQSRLHWTLAQS